MIKLLRINNIALIASAELEFAGGLNLLTGETGAGKSILIDALGLLLGARASADLIRSGESSATVEAVLEAGDLSEWLRDHGLPSDDPEIVLRREITGSGKGRATINGALAPVSLLRDLGEHVVAVHGQHEPQGLLDPRTHLAVLDRYAGLGAEVEALEAPFRKLREIETAIEELESGARESLRRREELQFQVSEIEKAGLGAGEEEALRQEKIVQANAGRLATLSGEAYAMLFEEERAVVSLLATVYRRIEELASIDARFKPYAEAKGDALAPLQEMALFLRDYQEGLHVTPGRLDEIESRLATIERLKRRYGASVEEVLAFAARGREQLEDTASPEERLEALAEERKALASQYLEAAERLSKKRRGAAPDLEKKVESELAQLAMERTRFGVRFTPVASETPASWTPRGLEEVEFLLSPNPGEELRPLARIASGGELSRIMLALKSVARLDSGGMTLVFDEVDAGIGGRVAEIVGKKLRAIAKEHQVLCVTHLPQIASMAEMHYAVRKRVDRGRTVAEVRTLEGDERIEEVARMLGGETITDAARRHAREMVKQSLRS